MPPQPPRPLDQGCHRRQLRHHHIEIEIKRGFHHLRGHQHPPWPWITSFPVCFQALALMPLAVVQGKARMQQVRRNAALAQGAHRGQRLVHRVAHPDAGRALCRRLGQQKQALFGSFEPVYRHRTPGRRTGRNRWRRHARHRQNRIGPRRGRRSHPPCPGLEGRNKPIPQAQVQRRRHQHRRPALRRVQVQQGFQQAAHVGVAHLVRLVHDQDGPR